MKDDNNLQGAVQPQAQPMQQPSVAQPVQQINQQNGQLLQTAQQVQAASADANGGQQGKKKDTKKLLIIIISAVMSFILVVVIVVVVLLNLNKGGSGNNVSLNSVKEYCEKTGFSIEEGESEANPKMEYVVCQGNDYDNPGLIVFGMYEKPVMQYEEYSSIRNMVGIYGEVLVESDNYLKVYSPSSTTTDMVMYLVVDDRSYIQITMLDENTARQALIAMGYADSDWLGDQQNPESADLASKSKKADMQRRNDVAKVMESLIQYQTNHNGDELPTGPAYWKATTEFDCNENVACSFVKDYMNKAENEGNNIINSFKDPDGTPYSLYITENWMKSGRITPTFGNINSNLDVDGDGYTISGNDPLKEHIMYIIPGARCNESQDKAVKGTGGQHFGILYMLEDRTIYCVDDL